MRDDGGSDVALDGVNADCGEGRDYCWGCEMAETVFTFFVSADSKETFGESVYCGEFYCECVWIGVGGDAGGGLSYNSEWLKKSLKKSRIFTDLVLLKKAAFNPKVEIFRLDGADSKKN